MLKIAFLLAVMAICQSCVDNRPDAAAATREMLRRYPGSSVTSVRIDEDEVAARTFEVRYATSDGAEQTVYLLFLPESNTWTTAPKNQPSQHP